MNLSPSIMSQVFALPAQERFELAQQLLDSIDDTTATQLDDDLIAELHRRRDEMLRGEGIISDWRAELDAIELSLPRRKSE